MKLSEMKQVLTERDLKLTKSLGQNFLHDQNQIRRIVAAAELGPQDKVLEIGPGLGPLTEFLAQEVGEVLALEKDHRLVEFLHEKFSQTPRLKVIHQDALEYLRTHRDWSDWKLVSNLPYSVASPLLVELAQAQGPPERMVATLQLEVVERLAAIHGNAHYGVLTLLVQLRYQPQAWFKIPASCFYPAPEVDSGCIILVRRPEPLLAPALHTVFTKIVKRGFSQRRKMMLKLLKQDWSPERLLPAFEKLQLSLQVRAEQVSLNQFVDLTRLLS